MKELKVGMLGAGFIGTFHSYALRLQSLIKSPPEVDLRLLVLADRDQKASETLIERFGWEKGVMTGRRYSMPTSTSSSTRDRMLCMRSRR